MTSSFIGENAASNKISFQSKCQSCTIMRSSSSLLLLLLLLLLLTVSNCKMGLLQFWRRHAASMGRTTSREWWPPWRTEGATGGRPIINKYQPVRKNTLLILYKISAAQHFARLLLTLGKQKR